MNEAVVQFVSPQQNGFVPGGFLAENIMLLKLIQEYVENETPSACISCCGTPSRICGHVFISAADHSCALGRFLISAGACVYA